MTKMKLKGALMKRLDECKAAAQADGSTLDEIIKELDKLNAKYAWDSEFINAFCSGKDISILMDDKEMPAIFSEPLPDVPRSRVGTVVGWPDGKYIMAFSSREALRDYYRAFKKAGAILPSLRVYHPDDDFIRRFKLDILMIDTKAEWILVDAYSRYPFRIRTSAINVFSKGFCAAYFLRAYMENSSKDKSRHG